MRPIFWGLIGLLTVVALAFMAGVRIKVNSREHSSAHSVGSFNLILGIGNNINITYTGSESDDASKRA